MLNSADTEFLRRTLPFFPALTDAQRQRLLDQSRVVAYDTGQTVHRGSDDCIGVVAVRSGELRAYILSPEGKEVTLYRLSPGEVCTFTAACIMQNITFDIHVEATRPSVIVVINPATFEQIRGECPAVESFVSDLVATRFSDVMWVMEQILFMSFDERLAIFLIDQSSRDGSDTIAMTHETIARNMGTAREVVSRMLKYFSTEGLVKLSRGGVTLTDKPRLRAMIP